MKTEKEINEMIETMKKQGRESENDIEKKLLLVQVGILKWALK